MSNDLLTTVKAEHELKCWPEYFQAVLSGDKPFEVRNNDRDFKVGDTLWLREWGPVSGYTGNEIRLRVTYMLEGPAFGIAAGYVVMGLESALAAEVHRLRMCFDEPMETLADMRLERDVLRLNLTSMQKFTDEIKAENAALRRRFADMEARRNALFEEATALRQRHGEAVEKAYREGLCEPSCDPDEQCLSDDELWLASSAKQGLEGEHD